MASDSKKTISFSVDSLDHKHYLNEIAREKGFRNAGDMSRYAISKLLTGYRLSFTPEKPVTARDSRQGGFIDAP